MPESQDGAGSLNITWSYSNGSEHQGKIDLASLRKSSYSLATSSTPPSTVRIASNLVSHYQWWIQVCAWCIQANLFMNCLSAERLVHRVSSMDKRCEISYTVRCCLHPAESIYNKCLFACLRSVDGQNWINWPNSGSYSSEACESKNKPKLHMNEWMNEILLSHR